ncbi:hypothetical protein RRG08_002616 [Elysia crispata]|uniref:Uncharacterized protein n=1 Tax=Elysia crispata TaxID=231223 RepID=A0AAE1CSK7_9GAST|nr:hypothetical protein RRG08_002616 [Elysia crispata]
MTLRSILTALQPGKLHFKTPFYLPVTRTLSLVLVKGSVVAVLVGHRAPSTSTEIGQAALASIMIELNLILFLLTRTRLWCLSLTPTVNQAAQIALELSAAVDIIWAPQGSLVTRSPRETFKVRFSVNLTLAHYSVCLVLCRGSP